MSGLQLKSWYLFILASVLCLFVEGTISSGKRPASLLVSNAIERASSIEQPAISTPDKYKAHFIKQGKVTLGVGHLPISENGISSIYL